MQSLYDKDGNLEVDVDTEKPQKSLGLSSFLGEIRQADQAI